MALTCFFGAKECNGCGFCFYDEKAVAFCATCHEKICTGQRFLEVNGKSYCESCLSEMSLDELLALSGLEMEIFL